MLDYFSKRIVMGILLSQTFLFADFTSNEYTSIYKDSHGHHVDFRDTQLYSYNISDSTYTISHIPKSINPASPKYHQYKDNFKIFIPIYTTSVYLSFSRWGSSGWFDLLVSLDKKPYKGPNNLFEQGSYAISNNATTGSNPLGIYEGSGCQDDFSCKVYFNRQESNNYGGPYSNANWLTYLNNGWTIRYARAMGFVAEFSGQNFTQSKWLYVATDTRPTATGANFLQTTDYGINIKVDASKVNAVVKNNSLNTKYASECQEVDSKAINACYFVKAFGNDDNIIQGYEQSLGAGVSIATTSHSDSITACNGTYETADFTASGGTPIYTWKADNANVSNEKGSSTKIQYDTSDKVGTISSTLTLTDSVSSTATSDFTLTIDSNSTFRSDMDDEYVKPNSTFNFDISKQILECQATDNGKDYKYTYNITSDEDNSSEQNATNTSNISWKAPNSEGNYTVHIQLGDQNMTFPLQVKITPPIRFKNNITKNAYTFDTLNINMNDYLKGETKADSWLFTATSTTPSDFVCNQTSGKCTWYTFNNTGTFTIKATAISAEGDSDTETVTIKTTQRTLYGVSEKYILSGDTTTYTFELVDEYYSNEITTLLDKDSSDENSSYNIGNKTLTITNATAGDKYNYTLTASYNGKEVSEENITITVKDKIEIDDYEFSNNNVQYIGNPPYKNKTLNVVDNLKLNVTLTKDQGDADLSASSVSPVPSTAGNAVMNPTGDGSNKVYSFNLSNFTDGIYELNITMQSSAPGDEDNNVTEKMLVLQGNANDKIKIFHANTMLSNNDAINISQAGETITFTAIVGDTTNPTCKINNEDSNSCSYTVTQNDIDSGKNITVQVNTLTLNLTLQKSSTTLTPIIMYLLN